jgi:hypothetical protein
LLEQAAEIDDVVRLLFLADVIDHCRENVTNVARAVIDANPSVNSSSTTRFRMGLRPSTLIFHLQIMAKVQEGD